MSIFMMIFSAMATIAAGLTWKSGGEPFAAFLCGAGLVYFLAQLKDILDDK